MINKAKTADTPRGGVEYERETQERAKKKAAVMEEFEKHAGTRGYE